MSETEEASATVARLLKTNLRVVKDDGGLASINVATQWQKAEAIKGFDGQVTVGLAESADQKIELTGNVRRRLQVLRINVWTCEQTGSAESGRVMRGKLVEEVNRVVRQKRRCPNQTVYDFYSLGAGSQTHKAYRGSVEVSPYTPDAWTELASEGYHKLWLSDDTRLELNVNEDGWYAAVLFGFKVESREKTANRMVLSFEGYGMAASGDGVLVKVWNRESSAWENAQTGGAGGSDENLTITLSSNLPDYIDKDGYVWLLAKTANPASAQTPAVLHCDYACVDVTVNGITYCDVVSYRNLDHTDVVPFLLCTEFVVKSWFFENIGV